MGREKSKSVVIPLSDKVLEIESDPIPWNMRELRSFFASTNQIIKFVPNLASLESPLRTLLNKKSTISRSDVYNMAFENIKSKIINKTENKSLWNWIQEKNLAHHTTALGQRSNNFTRMTGDRFSSLAD